MHIVHIHRNWTMAMHVGSRKRKNEKKSWLPFQMPLLPRLLLANDDFQCENVICCSILFNASTFTAVSAEQYHHAFETLKINVKWNVIRSKCARCRCHCYMTRFIAPILLSRTCSYTSRIAMFFLLVLVLPKLMLMLLLLLLFGSRSLFISLVHIVCHFLCATVASNREYISTIGNRSIDCAMHFS